MMVMRIILKLLVLKLDMAVSIYLITFTTFYMYD